jgi:diguanylate cyclase (GGDEF)-like protein
VPNLATLLAIAVFTPALAGGLLLLSWLQHRNIVALALWGAGFITTSIATTLIIVARGTIPDFWSIVVGNALLAVAYGILWSGARKFEGKKAAILLALLGAAVWMVACSIGSIYGRPEARATVIAAIAISYTLLALLELWRGRGDGGWRWPIMLLLLAHAAAVPIQIPLAGAWLHPNPSEVDLLTFVIFEGAFVSICSAYLFGSLAKDRIAVTYLRASLTDPLTGVANRRGFFHTGERLLIRANHARQPTALLMFDLDRFKSINDTFGHQTGDEVLTAFCRLATSQLRPTDLFARIGGEEFVMLLPDMEENDALRLAERLRTAFEATSCTVGKHALSATVSVGVAIADRANPDLDALLKVADQALYRAKAAGRNRVTLAWRGSERQPIKGPAVQSDGERTSRDYEHTA